MAQGKPEEQLPILIEKWGIKLLTFEKDTEPYAILRDSKITASLSGNGVKVSSFCSHTLYESEHYIAASHGKAPTSYVAFCKLFLSMGKMRQPIGTITSSQVIICTFILNIGLNRFSNLELFLTRHPHDLGDNLTIYSDKYDTCCLTNTDYSNRQFDFPNTQMSSSTVTHSDGDYLLPTLAQMGYSGQVSHKFPGMRSLNPQFFFHSCTAV